MCLDTTFVISHNLPIRVNSAVLVAIFVQPLLTPYLTHTGVSAATGQPRLLGVSGLLNCCVPI